MPRAPGHLAGLPTPVLTRLAAAAAAQRPDCPASLCWSRAERAVQVAVIVGDDGDGARSAIWTWPATA